MLHYLAIMLMIRKLSLKSYVNGSTFFWYSGMKNEKTHVWLLEVCVEKIFFSVLETPKWQIFFIDFVIMNTLVTKVHSREK